MMSFEVMENLRGRACAFQKEMIFPIPKNGERGKSGSG